MDSGKPLNVIKKKKGGKEDEHQTLPSARDML